MNEEILRGVFDIVKGILGVKSQNAEIMLTNNGCIVFRIDRSMLYVVQTELFNLMNSVFIKYNTEEIEYLYPNRAYDLENVYRQCLSANNLLYKFDNAQRDPQFEYLTKLKSKDGLGVYKLYDQSNDVTYQIPMFTGFVKFNKNDKCDIEVYDFGPLYYMNRFIVRKKKINYPIQVYFMTLKLNR